MPSTRCCRKRKGVEGVPLTTICQFWEPRLLRATQSTMFLGVSGFPVGTSGKEPACQCRSHNKCRFVKIPWRREWLPTPMFLPGEFHGQRSLAGYSPWGSKESDTTEATLPRILGATRGPGEVHRRSPGR